MPCQSQQQGGCDKEHDRRDVIGEGKTRIRNKTNVARKGSRTDSVTITLNKCKIMGLFNRGL